MNDDKTEGRITSNLQKFLNEYGNFVEEHSNVSLDVDVVLRDISSNVIDPESDDPQIIRLYTKGKNLSKQMSLEMQHRLKLLKDDKIYEIIMNIEQLNSQLNKQYNIQIQKGITNGIYTRNHKK